MDKNTKIKIIAHRGWSSGKNENTLVAFKKSVQDKSVNGVEFDIRWNKKRDKIIISHNSDKGREILTLEEGLLFLSKSNLKLFIEMKEFDKELFSETLELLSRFNLKQKTLIFGFRDVAVKFPWEDRGGIRFGIISEYPWRIKKDIFNFKPDYILMGWDDNLWTKFIFKLIWSVLSLPKICKKYSGINFVVGVAETKKDYNWLNKQKGLDSLTADLPFN